MSVSTCLKFLTTAPIYMELRNQHRLIQMQQRLLEAGKHFILLNMLRLISLLIIPVSSTVLTHCLNSCLARIPFGTEPYPSFQTCIVYSCHNLLIPEYLTDMSKICNRSQWTNAETTEDQGFPWWELWCQWVHLTILWVITWSSFHPSLCGMTLILKPSK